MVMETEVRQIAISVTTDFEKRVNEKNEIQVRAKR